MSTLTASAPTGANRNESAPPQGKGAPVSVTAPPRVRDELAWELVRDEWELLLAIGSGPTSIEEAAGALSATASQVERRVKRLVDHGLVAAEPEGGFKLVPAFYERREGMSSYLRDLVLRRLQEGAAPPISGRARAGLGSPEAMAEIVARAERELFPRVVALANRPESARSERFSVFFAFCGALEPELAREGFKSGAAFRDQLLTVLRAAATARSLEPDTRSSYLWVAEMRTDPEVAAEIGELLERFVDALESSSIAPQAITTREGAAAFAVLPATLHPKRQSEN